MSLVTLQIGQCGNQMGCELFSALADEAFPDDSVSLRTSDCFFREDAKGVFRPRALLLDMEPKVVNASLHYPRASRARWRYFEKNSVLQQSGSGNNWALGYHHHGSQHADAVLEIARKEMEVCDLFGGFLLLQSLAGGTGAGFGSRVAEAIRDEFPSSFIISQAIWPYESGEVVVQAYNSVLTMKSLLDVCDGVILVQNEDLHTTCQNVYDIQRPTFSDLNKVAAHALASLVCPAQHRAICPTAPADTSNHPRHAPLSPGAAHDLRTPPPRRLFSSIGPRSVVSRVSPQSEGQHNSPAVLSNIPTQLGRPVMIADIVRQVLLALVQVSSHPAFRVLSLRLAPQVPASSLKFTTFSWNAILKRLLQMFITRSGASERLDWSVKGCTLPLTRASQKCQAMLGARAYVHQYEQYGMEASGIEDAMLTVEEVVAQYEAM